MFIILNPLQVSLEYGARSQDKVMGQAMAWLTLYAGIKSILSCALAAAKRHAWIQA
jgi:hypothetical protein